MNWISLSLIMFVSSIAYYLLLKIAQNNKLDKNFYMIATYAIPSALFYIISLNQNYTILINPYLIFAILISSALINYIGSIVSYIAMQQAPNNGYSLVIQKSYAVFTSIAAIYVFDATLSVKKFLAILFIIFCSFIVSIQKGKKINRVNYSWVFYSVIALLCFGTTSLLGKYFIDGGVKTTVFLFWVTFFTLVISLFDLYKARGQKFNLTVKKILILIAIGLSFSSFTYFKQVAQVIAPNIGYVNAINASSNAFFTVLVAIIFKDHLNWQKLAAVVGITLGVIYLIS